MVNRWTCFGLLSVISIGAILFSFFAINLSGTFVYDSNFSVFHAPPDEVPD